MELTSAAKPRSAVEDFFFFRDIRSGVKVAESDAQCACSGADQAEEAGKNEQGTVATCTRLEEAPTAIRYTRTIIPSPVEATQPERVQHLTPLARERLQRSMRQWKGPAVSGNTTWRTIWRSALLCHGQQQSACQLQPTCSTFCNNTCTR